MVKSAQAVVEDAEAIRLRRALKRLARLFAAGDHKGLLSASEELAATFPANPVIRRAKAVALLNLGNPAAAAAAVADADLPSAADAEAASLLGLARFRLGQFAEARAAIDRACAIDPRYPPGWANLGALLAAQGDRVGAGRALRRALRLQPRLGSARIAYAQLLDGAGRRRDARQLLAEGAALPGAEVDIHLTLARLCSQMRDQPGELVAAAAAVTAAPRSAEAYRVLGTALYNARRYAEALPQLRKGVRLAPFDPRFAMSIAETQRKLGAHRAARATLRRALARWPGALALYVALANLHMDRKKMDRALAAARRAVELGPTEPYAHTTLGAVLYQMSRLDEAMSAYRVAISLDPRDVNACNAVGLIHTIQGRPMEAVRWFKRGLSVDPENPYCLFSLGLSALALGDWESGWPLYEWRWLGSSMELNQARPDVPGVAWWAGGSVRNRRLLVLGEQGHGDNLQFVRLLALLDNPAKVRLSMAGPLRRLMAQSLAHLPFPVEIIDRDSIAPGDSELFVTLLSLPARLELTQETLPPFKPWLLTDPAEAAAWRERLAGDDRPKVGFVWRGNPTLGTDIWRSTDIGLWDELLRRKDIRWVSLQKLEPKFRPERDALARYGVVDWTDELTDFAATAALVEGLDLVIAVDTSVAHLAGALGKPVWLLNRTGGEWRWGSGYTETTWYPSMRIFNQRELTQWAPVLRRVGSELTRWRRAATTFSPHS